MKNPDSYSHLLNQIRASIAIKREEASIGLKQLLVHLYWELGQHIITHTQSNKLRASYEAKVLWQLSEDLTKEGERGFSVGNLRKIRQFYLTYPDPRLLRTGIFWSHYQVLMRLDSDHSRRFYEEMLLKEKWSVQELQRQIRSFLYERILTHGKKARMETAPTPLTPPSIESSIKDPYMLDFLKLEDGQYQESDLEEAIISNLEKFLMELGYGFTFAGRQKRIQIGENYYYIDLVFFHRGLKCLVLIDLKLEKFTHADAGQMNMYLNYFRERERYEWEEEPIGIILCDDKDEEMVHYALGNLQKKIFVSRYKTQLPSEEALKKQLIAGKERFLQASGGSITLQKSRHPRKEKILACIKKDGKITVKEYCDFAGVSRPTAHRDLNQGLEEGWLEKKGKTRSAYYLLKVE